MEFIIWQVEILSIDQSSFWMSKKWFKWTSKNKKFINTKFISFNSLSETYSSQAALKCGLQSSMLVMKELCPWWDQWKAPFLFCSPHLDPECTLHTLFDLQALALSFGQSLKNFSNKIQKEKLFLLMDK